MTHGELRYYLLTSSCVILPRVDGALLRPLSLTKMALKRPLRYQNISIRTNSFVSKYLIVKISFGFSIFWANSFFLDSFGILFTLKKGTFSKRHKKCLSHRKKGTHFSLKSSCVCKLNELDPRLHCKRKKVDFMTNTGRYTFTLQKGLTQNSNT